MKMMTALVGALVWSAAAFAAEPVQISCPAESVQQLAMGQQDMMCMKDGKRVSGPMVMLYPSGKVMARGQTEGSGAMRAGKWTLFDETGAKTHVIDFKNGDFHGQWTAFHTNGQVKTLVSYDKGLKVGVAKEFDAQGKPLQVATK